MRTLLLLAAILVVSAGQAASAADTYWTVGSYNTLDRAKSEGQRVEAASGEQVRIAKFDFPGGAMYRLMVPQSANPESQRQTLANAGVRPWLAPQTNRQLQFVDSGEAASATKTSAMPQARAPVKTAANSMSITEHLLVVGSFSDMAHAETFADSFSGRGLAMIATARGESKGSTVYRVVSGPWPSRDAALRRKAVDAGIPDAWWITSSKLVIVKQAPAEPKVAVVAPPMPVPAEPEPPRPEPIRPPQPDESYFDYCLKKATPRERDRYCDDGQFSVAVREEQVRNGLAGQDYFDFCTRQASRAQREKYCKDMTFSDRVSP